MKKYSIALACAAIVALATTSVPTAKADVLNIGGDIGVFSDYVWRGQVQTAATPAVQGDVVFSTDALEGLSATIWGSNTNSGVSEWDFVVDFSNSIGDIGYSAGGIDYTYL
ncbi:MAG: TorF family putative porin, partial [Mariprofundaceae bacterium]